MTTTSPPARKIDTMMEKASQALADTAYFEAERLALKALHAARQARDFERMARIVLPLQEARRQRMQQALDVGTVTIIDEIPEEDTVLEPGCYLVRPPRVGADARRLRLAAHEADVPVIVVCREPDTMIGLWPIVAIGPGGSIRTKVDPADDADHPDVAWLAEAMEELGDAALEEIDPELEIVKRVDTLLDRIDTIPEHERLHQALAVACQHAHREADG